MDLSQAALPKGTRDFGPREMARRGYLFGVIREAFRAFGYPPIETPAMEQLSVLTGKYGDEGEKLLFRILNSGDPFSNLDFSRFRAGEGGGVDSKALSREVCEKGLRYDLTVPFARYVVQHHAELAFPFKRSQIQPVWRADRPQKGRYREFWQCDADVIGSASQLCECELVQLVDRVFSRLGIRVCVHVNNRKVLSGLSEVAGVPDRVTELTVAMDKLEKVGMEKVEEELRGRGIPPEALAVVRDALSLQGTATQKLEGLRALFGGGNASGVVSEVGGRGVEELAQLLDLLSAVPLSCAVELDFSLARGLDYYSGAIFEVKALDYAMGSICGGGRYDSLTGVFGLPGLSGVGISFGADRICDVLEGLGLFPDALSEEMAPRLLFAAMGEEELRYALRLAASLRAQGVPCEVYPEVCKLKRQFAYAQRRGIPFLSVNGSREMEAGQINVKNLRSGEERAFAVPQGEGGAACGTELRSFLEG